jgi:hypothetical protein
MRRLSFIKLGPTIPLWILVLTPGPPLSHPKPGPWDLSELGDPAYVDGAVWAVATTAAFRAIVLIFDFTKWIRSRSHE